MQNTIKERALSETYAPHSSERPFERRGDGIQPSPCKLAHENDVRIKPAASSRVAVLEAELNELRSATGQALDPGRLLHLATFGQIDASGDFLFETVAGPMMEGLKAVFDKFSLLLPLTRSSRRQVYFAVVAGLQIDTTRGASCLSNTERNELIGRFLRSRSKDLIRETYGACPPGYLHLIGRLGETARAKSYYTSLFELLVRDEDLGDFLIKSPAPEVDREDLLSLFKALPPTLAGRRAAFTLGSIDTLKNLLKPYALLTGETALRNEDIDRLARGEAPAKLIEELYLQRPFRTPLILDRNIRHAACGKDLVELSRKYRNCLATRISDGLKGRRQFYVWERDDKLPIIFSIADEQSLGWYLEEYSHPRNRRVPPWQVAELRSFVARFGIRPEGPVEKLMQPFWPDSYQGPVDVDPDFFPI